MPIAEETAKIELDADINPVCSGFTQNSLPSALVVGAGHFRTRELPFQLKFLRMNLFASRDLRSENRTSAASENNTEIRIELMHPKAARREAYCTRLSIFKAVLLAPRSRGASNSKKALIEPLWTVRRRKGDAP